MGKYENLVIEGVVKGLSLEESEHAARVAIYGYDPQQENIEE